MCRLGAAGFPVRTARIPTANVTGGLGLDRFAEQPPDQPAPLLEVTVREEKPMRPVVRRLAAPGRQDPIV